MDQRNYVGIEVSARSLEVALAGADHRSATATFANTSTGHRQLIKWATKRGRLAQVCLAATGVYRLAVALVHESTVIQGHTPQCGAGNKGGREAMKTGIRLRLSATLMGLSLVLAGCLSETKNKTKGSPAADSPSLPTAADGAETAKPLPPVVVAEYDLAALEDAGAFQDLTQRDVQVEDDPLYKSGPRRFHGYVLSEILAGLEGFSGFAAQSHKLVWVCADGYRTTYDFHSISGSVGVLATGLSDREGYAWQSYTRGKMTLSPAPFYLVWEGEGADNRRPWPYQLTKLQVVSSERVAMRLRTPDPQLHGEGQGLYKKHCMSCHSINLIGGVMGPEMNVPRNILEYRSETNFIAFASDPQFFRARSPMPKMRYLGEDTLKKITGYVKSMSVRKVCVTAMGCAEYADALK